MEAFSYTQMLGVLAALGGGLLVGVQRERHKYEHTPSEPAGVRTFALVALVGAVATCLGAGMQWLAGLAISAFAVTAYAYRAEHEPGLTTEIALLATYLIGALAVSAPSAAAALFVVLVVLLQVKQVLHDFTRNVLSERELGDALLIAASVLIVLPLLPDRTFDLFDVLNPRRIWLFAVMIMCINALGYIALRAFGGRRGLLLAGFIGGFISSTATIAGMGQRARSAPALRSSCIGAALLSNVATLIQLALVLFAAAPWLLTVLWRPLLLAGIVAIVSATIFFWRHGSFDEAELPPGRPFDPKQAVLFALIISVAAFLAAALRAWVGASALVLTAAAAGFLDVHAAAISLAQLPAGAAENIVFAYAMAMAFTANSVLKCLAAGAGGRAFAVPIVCGVAAINVALVVAIWATSHW